MYNQLNDNLTESETKYKPVAIEDRLKDLYKDNKRTYVKCQCGCFIIRSIRVSLTILITTGLFQPIIRCKKTTINTQHEVISSSMTTDAIVIIVNQTLVKRKKHKIMFIILLMIQRKRYDNETTDDMIKNENKKV